MDTIYGNLTFSKGSMFRIRTYSALPDEMSCALPPIFSTKWTFFLYIEVTTPYPTKR